MTSCASTSSFKNIQPQINSLVAARHLDRAIQFLDEGPSCYGPNNELLYWLDKGMALHLAGRYRESAGAFEEAKRLYDDLYGRTLSEAAGSALVNDTWKRYRGEDFEYVLLNVVQALNFAGLGQIDEALADIRNVDAQLKLISDRYSAKQYNVYKDDAFVHLLGGALYAALGTDEGANDAFISNVRALKLYKEDDQRHYKLSVPDVLKRNLLGSAAAMGDEELRRYQEQFPGLPVVRPDDRGKKTEVYLIQYTGFAPVKTADALIIPVDGAHVVKMSFPKLVDRFSEVDSSAFSARAQGVEVSVPTEIGEDIGALARQILDNRKVWAASKGVLRPLGKYILEKTAEGAVRRNAGDLSADVATVLSNVYNLATEEADVRTWQTLPGQIRIARLALEDGRYEFFVSDYDASKTLLERRSLGERDLRKGETVFLVTRSYR